MSKFPLTKVMVIVGLLALGNVACGNSNGGGGSGGTSSPAGGSGGGGHGGNTGLGGANGSGGAQGTTTETGGHSGGGGGTPGAGGTNAGAGGQTGQGGVSGSGGSSSGGAGATGTGGAGPASGGRTSLDAGSTDASSSGGTNSGGSGVQAGGAGGAPSTGGTSGSSGYNPCKASPCVVLPLGDSITHGFGSTDDAGYRSPLFKLIVAANQNVTFIGSLTNGPATVSGKTFPSHHEGHDGITVSGITGWVPPAKAFSATPHIVLLHIGTNDVTSNADPTTTANQLDTLVSNLVAAAPDALIVVAKIVPLFYASTTYNNYVAKIPGIVSAHAAKNQHVIMVDMSTMPTSDLGNGVHPSDQGYAYMGNLWYTTIKDYLPN